MSEDLIITRDNWSPSHRDVPHADGDSPPRARRPTLPAQVVSRAAQFPDAPAIAAPAREPLSYAHLRLFLEQTSARLAELGVGRDERVAVALPAGPELAVCLLAVTNLATCAPLNPEYTAGEFERYFDRLRVSTLIVQAGTARAARMVAEQRGLRILELTPNLSAGAGTFDLASVSGGAQAEQAAAEPFAPTEGDDVALVLQTSGTTARPKVVPLTHANILAATRNMAAVLRLDGSDICLSVLPLFHIHGFSALLATLLSGGCVVCPPNFTAPQFFGWLEQFHPTWYTAAPTIHQAVLAHAPSHRALLDQHSLRFIRSASSAMPLPVIAEMERTFRVPFIEAYGMTEAAPQISSNPLPPAQARHGSVGLAAGPEIAILDAEGGPLPAGVAGEVAVRGENITAGYEDDVQANARAFTNGWFRTGDEGYRDGDGYLFVTGRLREMINRGGEKIAPREVDEALLAHEAVAEAAAFALPHPTLGDEVAAAVVLRPGASATEEQLRSFVAEQLAYFKVPRQIVLVAELPKGPTAKLLRTELAARFAHLAEHDITTSAEPSEGFVAPSTPLERELAAIWASVLEVERVGIHDDFFALGGDSMLAMLVISRIADLTGFELAQNELFESPTVAELAVLLGAQLDESQDNEDEPAEFAAFGEEPSES
jgi:oxalate---CoA ligase